MSTVDLDLQATPKAPPTGDAALSSPASRVALALAWAMVVAFQSGAPLLASPEGKTLLADLPNLTNDMYPIIAVEHRKLDD